MNWSYSLFGITRAGSKGMISARNIKAPHYCVCMIERLKHSKVHLREKKRKKNNPGSGSNSFRGTKIRELYGK